VIINNQYDSLKVDYEQLKNNKEQIIDSLNKENHKTRQTIKVLEDSLKVIDVQLSGNSSKIKSIKKEEFVVSVSLSESAKLLKKNLSCTKL
jgi:hypothetical protein